MDVAILDELLTLVKSLNEVVGVPQSSENLVDKNILQGNTPSDPNKKIKPVLNSNERRRTIEIATLFSKIFFEYQKKNTPDTAIKTSVGTITKSVVKPTLEKEPEKKKGSWWWVLGPLAALVMGIMSDGPLKGLLKIIGKLGITSVLKVLKFKIEWFLKGIIRTLKVPFEILEKFFGKGIFGKIFEEFSHLIKAPFKAIGRVVGKVFGGGTMAKIAGKFLKPLAKVLKRIPLLGILISVGFAASRYLKGDVVGGTIDLLSGAVSLLDIVAPGLGTTLSIGVDVLNAWLDYKASQPENKNRGKLDILKDMTKSLGSWLWKNAEWIPILATVKRLGNSYNAFMGGNVIEGLRQFGEGLLSFTALAPLVTGFDMLMGFDNSKQDTVTMKKNSDILWSVAKSVGAWIWDKAEWIPVLGGIKKFGESYDKFMSGDIMGGIHQFGSGLLSLSPAAPFVTGLEMLLGFGEKTPESDKKLTPNTSWYSKLKKWIFTKLNDLPWYLRKPLEWMGILDQTEDIPVENISKNVYYNKLQDISSSVWNGFKDGVENVKDLISNSYKKITNIPEKLWEFFPKGIDVLKDSIDKSFKNALFVPGLFWKGFKKGITILGFTITKSIDLVKNLPKTLWKGFKGGITYLGYSISTAYKVVTFLPKILWKGFSKGVGFIGDLIGSAYKKIAKTPEFLWKGFEIGVKVIAGIIKDSYKKVVDIPRKIWENIEKGFGYLGDISNKLVDSYHKIIDNISKIFDVDFLKDFGGNFKKILEDKFGFFNKIINEIWNIVSSNVKSVVDGINDRFPAIKDVIMSIFDVIGSTFGKIKNLVFDLTSKIPSLKDIQLPSLKDVYKSMPIIGDRKEQSTPLTEEDKFRKAHEAGYNTYDEYEKSGWKYKEKPTPEQKTPVVTVNTQNINISLLEKISVQQLKTLKDIHKVAYAIFESTKGGMGGKGSVVSVPAPSSGSTSDNIKKTTPIKIPDQREQYSSSPYALA